MNKELLAKITILYVEDQKEIKNFTTDILKTFVKNVVVASNGEEGLEKFKKNSDIDLVIADINMPKMDGLTMSKEIKKINPSIPIIITTAHTDSNFLKESINLGIYSYTLKPIDLYDLVNNIIKSLESVFLKYELKNKNLQLTQNEEISELIEKQDSLIAIYDRHNIINSNNSFNSFFKEDSIENSFIKENSYFSMDMVPSHLSWYEYIKDQDELQRVVKIDMNNEIKIFKIDIIFLDNSEYFLLSLFDISKLNEKSNLLDYKSNHDNTTGLYNINKFYKLFSVESKRARRYRKNLSIFLFDFDEIILKNDSLYDKIIIKIANLVNQNIREHDINFKWDNSSFMIMLPETDLDGALNVSYKLEESLKDFLENNNIKSKVYFGVTELTSEDNDTSIISRVKKALNNSKNNNENISYL